jgi:hypothetical protein
VVGYQADRGTHGEVLLIGEHEVGGIGVIGAVGFINAKFLFLLFRKDGENEEWRSDNGTTKKRTRCSQLVGNAVPTAGPATKALQCPRVE